MSSLRSGPCVPVTGGAGDLGSRVVVGLSEGAATQAYGGVHRGLGHWRRFSQVPLRRRGRRERRRRGRYGGAELVNPRTGREITICQLVELIAVRTGFTSKIGSGTSKAGVRPRQGLDFNRAREQSGLATRMLLAQGLRATIRSERTTARS